MDQFSANFTEQGLLAAIIAAEDNVDLHWPVLLLAILTPLLIIYCRNESRIRRLKMLQDFMEALSDNG
jgi:hypothetical protein